MKPDDPNGSPPPPLGTFTAPELEARVVAWVLGEASAFEAAELARLARENPELALLKRRLEAVHGLVREATLPDIAPLRLAPARRAKLLATLGAPATPALSPVAGPARNVIPRSPPRERRDKAARRPFWLLRPTLIEGLAACLVIGIIASIIFPTVGAVRLNVRRSVDNQNEHGGVVASAASPARPEAEQYVKSFQTVPNESYTANIGQVTAVTASGIAGARTVTYSEDFAPATRQSYAAASAPAAMPPSGSGGRAGRGVGAGGAVGGRGGGAAGGGGLAANRGAARSGNPATPGAADEVQARQNALAALQTALGQLSQFVGSDQRITAPAEFAQTDNTQVGGYRMNLPQQTPVPATPPSPLLNMPVSGNETMPAGNGTLAVTGGSLGDGDLEFRGTRGLPALPPPPTPASTASSYAAASSAHVPGSATDRMDIDSAQLAFTGKSDPASGVTSFYYAPPTDGTPPSGPRTSANTFNYSLNGGTSTAENLPGLPPSAGATAFRGDGDTANVPPPWLIVGTGASAVAPSSTGFVFQDGTSANVGGSGSLVKAGNGNVTFTVSSSGTAGLGKGGSGTLFLTGTNSYTGPTFLSGGVHGSTASVAFADPPLVSTSQSANLAFREGVAVSGLSGGTDADGGLIPRGKAINGAVASNSWAISAGPGGLTKSGSGTLAITGIGSAGNYRLGGGGGELQIRGGNMLGNTPVGSVPTPGGRGALGSTSFTGGVTTDGGTNLSIRVNQPTDIVTTGNVMAGMTGGTLTKNGGGTWTLSGSNSYTGGTTINGGTLLLGSSSSPGSTPTISGGTLTLAGAITGPSASPAAAGARGFVDVGTYFSTTSRSNDTVSAAGYALKDDAGTAAMGNFGFIRAPVYTSAGGSVSYSVANQTNAAAGRVADASELGGLAVNSLRFAENGANVQWGGVTVATGGMLVNSNIQESPAITFANAGAVGGSASQTSSDKAMSIEQRVAMGRAQYLAGDLEAAQRTMRDVAGQDSQNAAAQYFLNQIDRQMTVAATNARETMAATMLRSTTEAWAPPSATATARGNAVGPNRRIAETFAVGAGPGNQGVLIAAGATTTENIPIDADGDGVTDAISPPGIPGQPTVMPIINGAPSFPGVADNYAISLDSSPRVAGFDGRVEFGNPGAPQQARETAGRGTETKQVTIETKFLDVADGSLGEVGGPNAQPGRLAYVVQDEGVKAKASLLSITAQQTLTGLATMLADAPRAPSEEDKQKAAEAQRAELLKRATVDEARADTQPVSTFALHVGDASYRLALTALARGERPDPAAIRPEEFYNAFDYGDPAPAAGEPVGARVEQAAHPFLQAHNLVRVAVKVPAAGRSAAQPLRLTVLLDTSGSMEREDRAATVRAAMRALAGLLGPADRVTLIGFARTPRLLGVDIPGNEAAQLADLALRTPAEGGTNLEEALKAAAELAAKSFLAGAQNRVVLMTDGAANLGDADPERLAARIADLREHKIAFDACGVGTAGLDDAVLEALTRKGGGRYYVLARPEDADAGFARRLAGAFRPAAENVKAQVTFNPARVGGWRLIGFEQHRLKQEDFRNDAVDGAAVLASEEEAVALYQLEVKPDGDGDLGEVAVRFRDAATGQMVERAWPLLHDPAAKAFDRAAPTLRLAGTAAMLADKLRGGATAEAIRLGELAPVANGLRVHYAKSPRVQELVTMFGQMRRLLGE